MFSEVPMEEIESADRPQYTPDAIAHVRSGIQQALRGEFVPEQEVEDFFADWEKELLRGAGTLGV
jgi:predicted transcriptional regulator